MENGKSRRSRRESRDTDILLSVDNRGRIILPESIRERLGIDPKDRIPATVTRSVLRIEPKPSSKLETATAGRDDWANTTPTDAGETLFGTMERGEHAERD